MTTTLTELESDAIQAASLALAQRAEFKQLVAAQLESLPQGSIG